jgi:hypothetical protein
MENGNRQVSNPARPGPPAGRGNSVVRYVLTWTLVLGLALLCHGQSSEQGKLLPLLEVLKNAGVSGSLEFSGTCDSFGPQNFLELPRLATPPAVTDSPLQTVRGMFASNPSVQVSQDSDGTIRIIEDDVPTDILAVKIAEVSFGIGRPAQEPIYDANAALAQVFVAPEVQRFMRDHDIESLGFTLVGAISPSAYPPSAPHTSAAPLHDVTFSQALDYILRSFPGIWYYRNCPATAKRQRMIAMGFYHLQKAAGGWIVQ